MIPKELMPKVTGNAIFTIKRVPGSFNMVEIFFYKRNGENGVCLKAKLNKRCVKDLVEMLDLAVDGQIEPESFESELRKVRGEKEDGDH